MSSFSNSDSTDKTFFLITSNATINLQKERSMLMSEEKEIQLIELLSNLSEAELDFVDSLIDSLYNYKLTYKQAPDDHQEDL